jgi:hypothetical protein
MPSGVIQFSLDTSPSGADLAAALTQVSSGGTVTFGASLGLLMIASFVQLIAM